MTGWESAPPPQHMDKLIYLDYQATTPIDPRVRDTMWPYFGERFGNPHSASHAFGWQAEEAVQMAREQVAQVIGASDKEIIFTSGATEANNLAIQGAAHFQLQEGAAERRHIITVATEHKAVLAPCESLQNRGFRVTVLPVQPDGVLDLSTLKDALRPETLLVSVMAVNNEIGVIQPLAEIGALCRANGSYFHTDAAQGFGKIPLNVDSVSADFLSISGHKIYGPMGIGALYVRRKPRARLLPLFSGGGQERGLRSGTLPLPLVVGLGKASEIAAQEMTAEHARLSVLRDRFLQKLSVMRHRFQVNGSLERRIPGNLNLSFPGIPEDQMLSRLRGLAVSTGSACHSGSAAPSYVLAALGISEQAAKTAIRFGFGRFTQESEIDAAAEQVVSALASG